MNDLAICTIVSKNYLPFARTLAESYLKYNKGEVFVLLVDRVDGYFEPDSEKFRLIEIEGLRDIVPEFDNFCFKYTILELNTAIKPYLLEYLFKKYDIKKLVYFDPDILITNNLSEISRLLDEYSIILTPHLTAPINDDYWPSEVDTLMSGAYNLGFLALTNNPTTASLLSWWQDRLYDKCIHAVEKGLFVDQKWMDLVPGMYEGVFILREPGYNVGYWNFHCRKVKFEGEEISVNGKPSYFFHFSGFDPENFAPVSKHQNRYKMSNLKEVRPVFELYRDKLFENNHKECKNWPYVYKCFDNGIAIPDFVRRLYLSLGNKARKFGNPFVTGKNSYFEWLNEKMDKKNPPITRFIHEIYKIRRDVQKVFPDVFGTDREGFVAWAATGGKKDHHLDDIFFTGIISREPGQDSEMRKLLRKIFMLKIVNQMKEPLKKILKMFFWRSPKILNMLRAINNRLNVTLSMPTNTAIRESMNYVVQGGKKEIGINIAGYITSESGTGEGVRSNIRSFETIGLPYVLNNIKSFSRQNDRIYTSFSESNPYYINFVHVNADQVPVFYSQKGSDYFRNHYNIGFWVWELSEFPEEWMQYFQHYDEIWTPSRFCVDAISSVSPIPVIKIPHSITINRVEEDRSFFGLRKNYFIFLVMFDFLSYFERKNPLAVIEAFRIAFQSSKDAVLVLKCSSSKWNPSAMTTIIKAVKGLNVRIIDNYLDRDELHALMSLSDCYVSLHRSEGFSLPLAEFMYLGKPVIATAYSGNMDFMNDENGFLVKYKLVEIEKDIGLYKKGNIWADPDVEHASELMNFVYCEREEAQRIGKIASENIRRLLSPSTVGRQVKKRIELIIRNMYS